MPKAPIHVPRDGYRGKHPPRKGKAEAFNRLAARLESYINVAVAEGNEPAHVFTYGSLAFELHVSESEIAAVLGGIGGGTGITVTK